MFNATLGPIRGGTNSSFGFLNIIDESSNEKSSNKRESGNSVSKSKGNGDLATVIEEPGLVHQGSSFTGNASETLRSSSLKKKVEINLTPEKLVAPVRAQSAKNQRRQPQEYSAKA